MLSVNRYRIRHRAQAGRAPRKLLERLLQKPDDWLGANLVILAAASVFASATATLLAQRTGLPLRGADHGLAPDGRRSSSSASSRRRSTRPRTRKSVALTRRASTASLVLRRTARRSGSPTRWPMGFCASFGVGRSAPSSQTLSTEELRTVVAEAGSTDPRAPPADAALDPRPRACHGERHHDPAAGDRRHRRRGALG